MNRAALYQRSNGLQRRDAKLVIDNFAQYMQWRPDGQDSLLDIGCGSGDVTIDYILPMLPRNFSRLVGIDLSEPMVRHAREQYPHPNIDFHTLDFDGDIEKYISNTEPFDHITSFYCLHWLQNQQRAVQNIHRLLKPGGDCLLSLMTNCPLYDVYSRVAQYPEWAPYMADVNRFISPYHYSEEPCAEFTSMLAAAGFKEFTVKMRKRTHIFDGVDSMKSKNYS